ncbi:mismatch-specific DNA-glycosylase [Rhabdothermincola sediminis]|uniref:mismatch-specific DNA-glycosylase n=1 Tax=Rhabdothermincola sediminis TaxID=2751370 RepID=UPI001AA01C02|nr:mismatch-specific DNA-glycosylase [Rhabdothermincola sediminis]
MTGLLRLAHLSPRDVPLALAEQHRAMVVGERFEVSVDPGWPRARLRDVVTGAGFEVESIQRPGRKADGLVITARRSRTLADTVAPDMHLLVVGLNPSLFAADAGVGFARPGNRFWPAALAAGLVTVDRDPLHALHHHRVGMTDLVKRATARAHALSTVELRAGLERVSRLVEWLRPGAVCLVGITGWRAAAGRQAVVGVQAGGLSGSPLYVMPNTSGVNAHASLSELVEHLRAASALARCG